jgi:thiamine kinase-like enzyme
MEVEEAILKTTEYLLVLVQPDSRKILVLDSSESCRLPRVRIPQQTRPAEQLRKGSKAAWGLDVLILDFFPSQDASPGGAVAELLGPNPSDELRLVESESIGIDELSEQQCALIGNVLAGETKSPFSQLGWIDEAVAWLEAATQRKLLSKSSIHQLNAGGAFSLIRLQTEDGQCYWLKATGEPNAHELSITFLLSELCGEYLPELISSRPSWNAWLALEGATQITELPTDPFKLSRLLEDAVEAMANLQMRTVGHRSELLNAGAFDQGIQIFQKHSAALFDYLEEAMSLQTSTKVPRLNRSRLQEIRTIFEEICRRMEALQLPETIVHGDLNYGNILNGCGHCQFIDWCEAYLGNPLIPLQHLLLLNRVENLKQRQFINQALQQRYRYAWRKAFDPARFDAGFVYMPSLAIASSLLGRGDWLASPNRGDPRRQSYARRLARHMDRAVSAPELLEAICR